MVIEPDIFELFLKGSSQQFHTDIMLLRLLADS